MEEVELPGVPDAEDIYYYSFEAGGEPRRLTRSLSEKIDPEDLVEGEKVRFKSFGGLESFDDTDYLKSIFPLFHADKITKLLLVLQGANDPRVLQAESDDIVAAAKANGVPVEYIVFDDEGHGFAKKANQAKGYQAVLEFLDRHLAGG
jgi:dipeptidyl aminopeptidase/acylaminoacyl peptidase